MYTNGKDNVKLLLVVRSNKYVSTNMMSLCQKGPSTDS